MSDYQAWLFLQDGNACGLSLASLGQNLLSNPIEKIITYKSFLKLIPNPAQDISTKSKLKLVAEWTISGEYYQLYGWISGSNSKINMHNFELDDYPDQDFFGDLILFKINPAGHKCIDISEYDVHTIDIANREEFEDDDPNESEEEVDDEQDLDEDGNEEKKDKDKDENEEDEEDEEDENYDYEDDKPDGDDCLEEEDTEYYDDDDGDIEVSRKKVSSKSNGCNFTRLVCEGIVKQQNDISYTPNEKQNKIIGIFQKLLYPKKHNLNKNESIILRELERGILNWTIFEADKLGFMCIWDDRHFNSIYNHKGISIYQNLTNNNSILINSITDIKNNGKNAYQMSFMKPEELFPEKYTEIINQMKQKEKVIFEKRETVGSKHYKCGKCKERDVSVSTAQTRSGDEGITLFLTCNNCGNQWKMS